VHPIELSPAQKISLNHLNDRQKKNDEQWRLLDEHFALLKFFFSEENVLLCQKSEYVI